MVHLSVLEVPKLVNRQFIISRPLIFVEIGSSIILSNHSPLGYFECWIIRWILDLSVDCWGLNRMIHRRTKKFTFILNVRKLLKASIFFCGKLVSFNCSFYNLIQGSISNQMRSVWLELVGSHLKTSTHELLWILKSLSS